MLFRRLIDLLALQFKGIFNFFRKLNMKKNADKSLLLAAIQSDKEGKYTKATEAFLQKNMSNLEVSRKMNSLIKKVYMKGSKMTQRDMHVINRFFQQTQNVNLFDNPTKKDIKRIADEEQRNALLAAQRIAGGVVTADDISNILDIKLMYEMEVKKNNRSKKIKNPGDGSSSRTVYKDNEREIIQFYNSSWLIEAEYFFSTMKAVFKLKRAKRLYTFYEVPRFALYALQKVNGKGMWDGFGVFHSTNPRHWIRGRRDGKI